MASNHPSNYVGLEKRIKEAIDTGNIVLNPQNAFYSDVEVRQTMRKCAEVLGEAKSKDDELKGQSKYTELIKNLESVVDKLESTYPKYV